MLYEVITTINDRYFVIKEICQFLKKNNIVGIFLGGGQDYTFPMAKSFVSERNFINLCIVITSYSIHYTKLYDSKLEEAFKLLFA